MKQKQCKAEGCEVMFSPLTEKHRFHHLDCLLSFTRQKDKEMKEKAKLKRKAKKELKLNDPSELIKDAQKIFNKYIRKRDEKLPCVSCGYEFKYLDGEPNEGRQRQAGHFKNERKNSQLRFNEDNVHAQCNHCNDPFYGLKGNLDEYEKKLRVRIGDDRVNALNVPVVVKKWNVIELQEIIDTYKQKIKNML